VCEKREFEEAFVQIGERVGSGMEGDYVRFVNAVEVGVAQLPGQAQVRPKVVKNLCEPVRREEQLSS
jgi:hypothetical protein